MLIFDIDKNATLLEDPKDGTVLVQAGIIKTRVDVKNLRLLSDKQTAGPSAQPPGTPGDPAMSGGRQDAVSASGPPQ